MYEKLKELGMEEMDNTEIADQTDGIDVYQGKITNINQDAGNFVKQEEKKVNDQVVLFVF